MLLFSFIALLRNKAKNLIFLILFMLSIVSLLIVDKAITDKKEEYQLFLDNVVIKGESYLEGVSDTKVNYYLPDILIKSGYIEDVYIEESYEGKIENPSESEPDEIIIIGTNNITEFTTSMDSTISDLYISEEFTYNAWELEEGELPSILLDKGYMEKNNLSIGEFVDVIIDAGKKSYKVTYEVMGYMTSSMSTNNLSYSIVTFDSVRQQYESSNTTVNYNSTHDIFHYRTLSFRLVSATIYDEFNEFIRNGEINTKYLIKISGLLGRTQIQLLDESFLIGKDTFLQSIHSYELLQTILYGISFLIMIVVSLFLLLNRYHEMLILRSLGTKKIKIVWMRCIQYAVLILVGVILAYLVFIVIQGNMGNSILTIKKQLGRTSILGLALLVIIGIISGVLISKDRFAELRGKE